MVCDCFECLPTGVPPVQPPLPSPCIPVQLPHPQVWMLWSMPIPVEGCPNSANMEALAWLTLTEIGFNMDINLVHTAGNATRISITEGEDGPHMFEVLTTPRHPGFAQGTFPSITQEQFDIMTSDRAWLTISTDACPQGALHCQIFIMQCPMIPVSAHLDSDYVVEPYTAYPEAGGVGIMVGSWNPSSHMVSMRTMVCMLRFNQVECLDCLMCSSHCHSI